MTVEVRRYRSAGVLYFIEIMAKKPKTEVPSIQPDRNYYVDERVYKTYSDKLKHPLWQRKRLEILNRDNWQCRTCGEINSPLQIHHRYYSKGHPWEIENEALITLCDGCHSGETNYFPKYVEAMAASLKKHGAMNFRIGEIAESLMQLPIDTSIPPMLDFMLRNKETRDMVKNRYLEYIDKLK